ncbi:hypothetical protein, partial [Paenibacillus dendritiformis]|uniref:hypothetical protein n=1 Tax=Paenibacillus dendritiformis TaxID=130049 RepID=UPI001BCC66AF
SYENHPTMRGGFVHYFLCFVGSTSLYPSPDFCVGGSGLPFVDVTSLPLLPPRGPTTSYWPDLGVVVPGFKGFVIVFTSFYIQI